MRTRPPTTRVSILYCQGSAGYKMKRTEKSYGCTGATTEKSSVVQSVSDCHGFNWGTGCTLVIFFLSIFFYFCKFLNSYLSFSFPHII